MTDYVLSGLVKRRADLSGEADAIRVQLAQIGTDLGHLDAVIRQFDPNYDLGGICPKRPRGPDVAGRGEMSRFILKVLREATRAGNDAGGCAAADSGARAGYGGSPACGTDDEAGRDGP